MPPDKQPRRLGRGLEALIGGRAEPAAAAPRSALRQVAIGPIRPNPYQPRKEFREEDLAELEASIRANGLLQPVTIRPAPDGKGYELVAGERRLRAAARVGWTEIPAIVKEIDDQALLTLALIENLQRTDLNPIEEAEGYRRLSEDFGLTQQAISDLVGKQRSTVANFMRLLTLPASIRRMLQQGELTFAHGKALLMLEQEPAMLELARETVAQQLSVREVERRARERTTKKRPESESPARRPEPREDPEAKRITAELRRYLQTDVELTLTGPERGQLHIAFYSADDLERLLELIIKGTRQ